MFPLGSILISPDVPFSSFSFQPARFTSEFVRKQLQSTIHGRQKPAAGKDLSGSTGPSPLAATMDSSKCISAHFLSQQRHSSRIELDQKGAYFRSQLSSQLSTPPLPNTLRNQPTHPGKPT